MPSRIKEKKGSEAKHYINMLERQAARGGENVHMMLSQLNSTLIGLPAHAIRKYRPHLIYLQTTLLIHKCQVLSSHGQISLYPPAPAVWMSSNVDELKYQLESE